MVFRHARHLSFTGTTIETRRTKASKHKRSTQTSKPNAPLCFPTSPKSVKNNCIRIWFRIPNKEVSLTREYGTLTCDLYQVLLHPTHAYRLMGLPIHHLRRSVPFIFNFRKNIPQSATFVVKSRPPSLLATTVASSSFPPWQEGILFPFPLSMLSPFPS